MRVAATTSVGAIGQDAARTPMTRATFSAVHEDADNTVPELIADDAWAAPSWRAGAVDYHKHRGGRVSVAPYVPEEIARPTGCRSIARGMSFTAAGQALRLQRSSRSCSACARAWQRCRRTLTDCGGYQN